MTDESQIITAGDICIDHGRHTVTAAGNPVELTFKEYELLRYMINSILILLISHLRERMAIVSGEGGGTANIATLRLIDCTSNSFSLEPKESWRLRSAKKPIFLYSSILSRDSTLYLLRLFGFSWNQLPKCSQI